MGECEEAVDSNIHASETCSNCDNEFDECCNDVDIKLYFHQDEESSTEYNDNAVFPEKTFDIRIQHISKSCRW